MSLKPLKPVKKAYVYMVRRQHLLVHEHVDYPDMPLALPGLRPSLHHLIRSLLHRTPIGRIRAHGAEDEEGRGELVSPLLCTVKYVCRWGLGLAVVALTMAPLRFDLYFFVF